MRYKIVPVEPTEEMVRAADYAIGHDGPAEIVWEDMLTAAPKPSDNEELAERVAMQLQQWDWLNNTVTAINRARVVLMLLEGDQE